MSEYIILGDTLTDIGDAIRAKTGGNGLLTPLQMPAEIAGIPTNISYTNVHESKTFSPPGTSTVYGFDVAITGTAGKKHRLYAAKASTSSTSSSTQYPAITDALTDVTDSVTSSVDGDTVTYTWHWTKLFAKPSSDTRYIRVSSLLLLAEE